MPDRRSFVAAEIVQDHDVAGPKFRHEHLVDMGLERFLIARAVEKERCRDPVEAQVRHESGCLPLMGGRLSFTTKTVCTVSRVKAPAVPARNHLDHKDGSHFRW